MMSVTVTRKSAAFLLYTYVLSLQPSLLFACV